MNSEVFKLITVFPSLYRRFQVDIDVSKLILVYKLIIFSSDVAKLSITKLNGLTSIKVNNKTRQLLEKRAEVGCNAEYGSNVVKLEMPFFIDQDRFAPFKNDYRYPHLKIHQIRIVLRKKTPGNFKINLMKNILIPKGLINTI